MRALVLGGAACVHTDAEQALALFTPDVIIAINDIGTIYPQVHHWVSKHPQKFRGWLRERAANKLPAVPSLWSADRRRAPDDLLVKAIKSTNGGSGLLAVRVAVQALHCDKVVLAGVPMSREGAHYFSTDLPWKEAKIYRAGWLQVPEFEPLIRSMSGWTMEVFGAPTAEWLAQEQPVA